MPLPPQHQPCSWYSVTPSYPPNSLFLGDKYDVQVLIFAAKEWLKANMNAEEVLETLRDASTVRCEDLVNFCVSYVIKNRKENRETLSLDAIRSSGISSEIVDKLLASFW